MADEEIKCQCGLSILVEWRPATSAATYLAEVRHRAAEFCDFDVEIRGSLVFTTWVSEKVM
jgi:hypothetical protein